jgi:hypothetical protein
MFKICANATCHKRFSVRIKKSFKANPNAHRKYCYDCDGVKIWENKHKVRAVFLRHRWAILNPEKAKARHRRHRLKKYGLTVSLLKKEQRKQKNRCAICRRKFNGRWKKPNVDHRHGRKGKHRGLLCVDCNLLIGHSRENIHVLKSAIRYLIFWRKYDKTNKSICQTRTTRE